MENELISKVWLLHGTFGGATPGLLVLSSGAVSFVTSEGEHFTVPVSEFRDVKWPFLQFGYGFTANVQNQKYRFTFMKPNGAPELDTSALGQIALFTRMGQGIDSMRTLIHMGRDKKTAKQWKSILSSSAN